MCIGSKPRPSEMKKVLEPVDFARTDSVTAIEMEPTAPPDTSAPSVSDDSARSLEMQKLQPTSDLRHDACTLLSCSHSEWPCAAKPEDTCAKTSNFHSFADLGQLIIECYNPRVVCIKAGVVLRLRLMKCAAIVVNEKASQWFLMMIADARHAS